MAIIGNLPGERLAGVMIDILQKVRHGGLSIDELELCAQRINPFAFERNEHGHIVLSITGMDLTGAQEIERLKASGFRFSSWAESCLLSTKADGYDAKHRLVADQLYKIALMPTKEIEVAAERTTENLRNRGLQLYRYSKPLGGGIPRIRERVSDKQMEEMGLWYIAAPHDPIEDSDGDPDVLRASRHGDGRWVGARIDRPGSHWRDDGAFAFVVPAS